MCIFLVCDKPSTVDKDLLQAVKLKSFAFRTNFAE